MTQTARHDLLWALGWTAATLTVTSVVHGCSDDETAPAGSATTASPSSSSQGGSGGSSSSSGGGGGALGCTETAPGPTRGSAVALSPDDAILVAVSRDAGSVAVIDVAYADGLPSFGARHEIALGGEPWQVAVDGCGDRAYVVLREEQKLVEIAALGDDPQPAREAAVGSEPTAVALSPNNRSAFVANWVEGTVSVIDTASMQPVKSFDLNAALASTGMLGPSVSGSAARPGLAHPRSVAVTNDGDDEDDDESLFVTEFFAQRTAPEANDGSNADVNWVGIVYRIDLSDDAVTALPLSSLADTGFTDGNGAITGCFPNQLQSITVYGGRVYVTSICASPEGPVDPKTMTHPVVHVLDAATGTEAAAPSNLNELVDAAFGTSPGRYPLVTNDLAFRPGTNEAYVIANGSDAAYRLHYDAGRVTGVGGDATTFIDLAPESAGADQGLNPIGIAVANGAPLAFVVHDVSRNVTAVDIDPAHDEIAGLSDGDPRVATVADQPADPLEQSRLRGKHFFQTGRDRWSLGGQGWGACQSCHFEGLSDNVTWYFARGPRQSTSLDGSFASSDPTDQRIFNWTAVFDEIHDFENVARGLDGAVGALVHTVSDPPAVSDRINLADATLFPPAGAGGLNGSAEMVNDTDSVLQHWDDIEAWIQQIRSPRAPVGLDPADVTAGRALFVAARCDGCHGGAKWTLSQRFYVPSGSTGELLLTTAYDGAQLVADGFPAALLPAETGFQFMRSPNPKSGGFDQIQCVLRPVGTFGISPVDVNVVELRGDMTSIGQGDEQHGRGFNVPSILGTQVGAPFFHAGNARTLEELLSPLFASHHAALAPGFDLQDEDLAHLVAFVLSIDESVTPLPLPSSPGPDGGDFCVAP